MKVGYAIVALVSLAPALVVAVALGPVILGILCAVGAMLLVAMLAEMLVGLGHLGHSAEQAAVRRARRFSRS